MKKAAILIASGVAAGAVASVINLVVKSKLERNIQLIYSLSEKAGTLTIFWYDVEPNIVYSVYWSVKPNIDINDPSTYTAKAVTSTLSQSHYHSYKLESGKEHIYYIISKPSNTTKEFHGVIGQDMTFTKERLDPMLLHRDKYTKTLSYEINVLENPDYYIVYKYYENRTEEEKIDVRGQKMIILKTKNVENHSIFLSYEKNAIISGKVFLFHVEKFSPLALKCKVLTKQC